MAQLTDYFDSFKNIIKDIDQFKLLDFVVFKTDEGIKLGFITEIRVLYDINDKTINIYVIDNGYEVRASNLIRYRKFVNFVHGYLE